MFVFLVKGWNITHGLTPVQIAGLAVFLVLLFFVLFLFSALIIYERILKNLNESLKEAEKIARNSLQNRLKRIDDILLKVPHEAKKQALLIWRTEYKLLIENKFLEQLEFIERSFVFPKLTRPTFKNLHHSKKCLNKLKLVSQKIYLLYRQTDKIMAWEMLQRDTRIQVRQLFNDLKEDIYEVQQTKNFSFNRQAMVEKIQSIDQALTVINLKIIEGNNLLAEAYQQKTNAQIASFIQLLNLFYLCEKMLNITLPEKINNLEKKMRATILDQNELKNNLNKLYTLNKIFGLYKNQIFDSLEKLDYNGTFQKLTYITEFIANFENDVQYQEKIKEYLGENLSFLNQLFEGLTNDLENVKNSLLYNEKLGKPMEKYYLQFTDLQKHFLSLNREWTDFYNFWSNLKIYQKDQDFSNLEKLLMSLMKELKTIYLALIKMSKNLKTENNLKEEIDAKILELRAFLSTSEVAMTKNATIVNCEKQKKAVAKIYTRLEALEREIREKKERLNFQTSHKVILELEKMIEQAFDIKNELKNKVLLVLLAESVIIYLDRYSSNEKSNQNFEIVWQHYEKNEWSEVLNLGIYALQSYHK